MRRAGVGKGWGGDMRQGWESGNMLKQGWEGLRGDMLKQGWGWKELDWRHVEARLEWIRVGVDTS
jgi:hypothetical protein